MAKPSSLRNLGPRTDALLAEVGVMSAEDLRAFGAVEAYARLKFAFGKRVTLNLLWGVYAGLLDRHWQSITREEKSRLHLEVSQKSDDQAR